MLISAVELSTSVASQGSHLAEDGIVEDPGAPSRVVENRGEGFELLGASSVGEVSDSKLGCSFNSLGSQIRVDVPVLGQLVRSNKAFSLAKGSSRREQMWSIQ